MGRGEIDIDRMIKEKKNNMFDIHIDFDLKKFKTQYFFPKYRTHGCR